MTLKSQHRPAPLQVEHFPKTVVKLVTLISNESSRGHNFFTMCCEETTHLSCFFVLFLKSTLPGK